ncbi:MAG: DUF4340 domain-containing protein [Nitrospinota bacterium]|nr:MAG: DUF4340 domain-containing protein [Nitrospinota bacterium]
MGEVKVRRVVAENPPDLDSFGLEHPQLEVEVGLVDGRTFSLLFGDKTPTGMAFYAKTKEAPRVFLVALGFRYRLGKGVDVLQAKQKKEEETSPTREGRVWPYRRYHAHDAVSRWAG